MTKRTLAIIPARAGSIRVPKKNIRSFCGKPLIAWTIDNCLKGGANSVWVSSDSDEILEISAEYGANKIHFPGIAQQQGFRRDHRNTVPR